MAMMPMPSSPSIRISACALLRSRRFNSKISVPSTGCGSCWSASAPNYSTRRAACWPNAGRSRHRGRSALEALIRQAKPDQEVIADLIELLEQITNQVDMIDTQIQNIEARLKAARQESAMIQRVQSIHTLGWINAK